MCFDKKNAIVVITVRVKEFESRLSNSLTRVLSPVNKEKIAKLAQMWRLLPPKHYYWLYLAMHDQLPGIYSRPQKNWPKVPK